MQRNKAWASHSVIAVEEGLRLLPLSSESHLYEQWYSLASPTAALNRFRRGWLFTAICEICRVTSAVAMTCAHPNFGANADLISRSRVISRFIHSMPHMQNIYRVSADVLCLTFTRVSECKTTTTPSETVLTENTESCYAQSKQPIYIFTALTRI